MTVLSLASWTSITFPPGIYQNADRPGTVRTSVGGWTMNAKIKGKIFKASSMYPPEASDRIIGWFKDGFIGLPYEKGAMSVGQKIKFSPGNKADLVLPGDNGNTWGGKSGEMEITKVSGHWVEGKFHFTATTVRNNSSVEVTDGFFRIQVQ